MTTWTEKDRDEALEAFVRKASTDADFRALALKDPATAVKQLTGRSLPDNFRIKAVDKAGADMVVVVPDLAKADGELSDIELESVAGGRCDISCGASMACVLNTL